MDEQRQRQQFVRRLWLVRVVFGCFIGLLVLRLWHVQVRQGSVHVEQIARESIRRIRVSPVRGRMLAADGRVLVDNEPSFDLVFDVTLMRRPGRRGETIAHIMQQVGAFAARLGRELPFDEAYVKRRLDVYPALPITVYTQLDEREIARASEVMPPVPGVAVVATIKRSYPFPGVATHVTGFAGRTRPPDEFDLRRYSYVMPELRGRAGLERLYDDVLSGRPGMRMVRVDTLGYVHAEIGRALPPKDGADLVLTLDLRAQTVADRLMHGVTGAMVVVDVNSGAVLAMASSPSYDLSGLTQDSYARMAGDLERRPLVNRALAAGYLPGSIIKPLIGMAILESGEGRPFDPLVYCPGKYEIGDTSIRCWRRVGHGDVDLVSAIERSCNTYFIKMGMTVGLDRIRPMLLGAGFGDAPGIDLPDAGAGLVPSREWAQRYWGRNWLAIDTAYLSIGQGAINVSPLQAALYVAAIGNGGKVFQPYIVREIRDPNGSVRAQTPVRVHHRLPVSVKTLQTIRAGMIRVVNGEHATAEVVRNPLISLAGKTGTAEVKSAGDEYNNTWFICYGPVDKPAYALAVVVERGESGGRTAAPLAARFFEQWLEAEE